MEEKELPQELQEKIGGIFLSKCMGFLNEGRERIRILRNGGSIIEEDLKNTVTEVNKTVDFVAGGDDAMYQEYSFKAYKQRNGEFLIFQGQRLNTDWWRKKEK